MSREVTIKTTMGFAKIKSPLEYAEELDAIRDSLIALQNACDFENGGFGPLDGTAACHVIGALHDVSARLRYDAATRQHVAALEQTIAELRSGCVIPGEHERVVP